MGIDDLFEDLGGLDIGKVGDVVETIWDDKDKIGHVVELVWDNKDRIVPVLDWVKEHGDDLLDLMQKVPEILGKAGNGLADAGESAIGAATWLIGQADDGVGEVVEIAASALDACWDELEDVGDMLGRLSNQIDGVKLPTFDLQRTEVAGIDLISGIDIGAEEVFDGAADRLRDGVDRVLGVAAGLTTVAEQLREVADRVIDAGGDLDMVGTQLVGSGSTLVAMSGQERKPPKRPKMTVSEKSNWRPLGSVSR